MKTKMLFVGVVWLGSTIQAQAAEMYTPPIGLTSSQFLQCLVLNVAPDSRVVRTRVYDSTGAQVADSGSGTIASMAWIGLSVPGTAAGTYCRFTVSGSKQFFRGQVSVLVPEVGEIVALPAE